MVKIKTNCNKEFFIKGTLSEVAAILNSNERKYVALIEDNEYINQPVFGIKYFYADSIVTIEVIEKIEFNSFE